MRSLILLLISILSLSCHHDNALTYNESTLTSERYLIEIKNLIRQQKIKVSEKLIDSLEATGKSFPILAYKSQLNIAKNNLDTIHSEQLKNKNDRVSKLTYLNLLLELKDYPTLEDKIVDFEKEFSALDDLRLEFLFLKNLTAIEADNNKLFDFEILNISAKDELEPIQQYYFIKSLIHYAYFMRYSSQQLINLSSSYFSMKLMEEWNLKAKYPKLYAECLSSIALAYLEIYNNEMAKAFLERAIDVLKDVDSSSEPKLLYCHHLAYVDYYLDEDLSKFVQSLKSGLVSYSDASQDVISYIKINLVDGLLAQNEVKEAGTLLLDIFNYYSPSSCDSELYLAYLREADRLEMNDKLKALTYLDSVLNIPCHGLVIDGTHKPLLYLRKAEILLDLCAEKSVEKYCVEAEDLLENNLFLNDTFLDKGESFHLSDMAVYTTEKIVEAKLKRYKLTDSIDVLRQAYNSFLMAKNRSLKIGMSNRRNQIARSEFDACIDRCLLELDGFNDTAKINLGTVTELFNCYKSKFDNSSDSEYFNSNAIRTLDSKEFDLFQGILERDSVLWMDLFAGEESNYLTLIDGSDIQIKQLNIPKAWVDRLDYMIQNQLHIDSIINTGFKISNEFAFSNLDKHYKSIIVSPDGYFFNTHFDVLPIDSSDNSMLIDQYNLSYAFDPFDLINNMNSNVTLDKLVLYAYSDGFQDSKEATEYPELEFSYDECRSISTMMSSDRVKWINSDKLTQNIFRHLGVGNILHLATHSFSDITNLGDNFLVYKNKKGSPEILHGLDIRRMNINSPLVVLSSCSSGEGQYVLGEGVFSLSREFVNAGAKSVVRSSWQVNDQSSSILMTDFYANLKNESVSESLRMAKLKMKNNYIQPPFQHPYYWAAFVVEGDPSLQFSYN